MTRALVRQYAELVLAGLLGLIFITPLVLTGVRYANLNSNLSRWLDRHWIGQPNLSGVTIPVPDAPLGWQTLRSADFQKQITARFNETFAGREALIRYTNELWFRLFRRPANPSSRIAVGKNDVLFDEGDLEEYFLIRRSRTEFEPWVKDLRRLQDACRTRDMGFVVVVSPSKASIHPEDIPPEWQRWSDPRPRVSVLLRELFRDYGIEFVDGIELLTEEKLKGYAAPLFPNGGMHWSPRGGLIAANAVQSSLSRQGKPAEPIELIGSAVVMKPGGEEDDLAELMNTASPWRFPIEKLTIKRSIRSKHQLMTAAIIADSFGWSLLYVLNDSGQFSDIGFFFHYWRSKSRAAANRVKTVRTPATPVDFEREIFAADCLILEINESVIGPENHVTGFLKDALANLPEPGAPKAKFRAD